jgi:hypothetical protein
MSSAQDLDLKAQVRAMTHNSELTMSRCIVMCAQSEPDICKDPKEQATIRIRREVIFSPPQYKSGQSMEELTVQECKGGIIRHQGCIFKTERVMARKIVHIKANEMKLTLLFGLSENTISEWTFLLFSRFWSMSFMARKTAARTWFTETIYKKITRRLD